MALADTILSVAEVKTQLFIPAEETSQDVLLTSYRDAAIEYVASRTGRLLLDETVVLEVPVRYVPLSSSPFRLADLKRVTQLDYHDDDTQFWNTEWWQGRTADPYFQGYGAWPHYTTYPSHGLRIYRTEADTPPDQQVGRRRYAWRRWAGNTCIGCGLPARMDGLGSTPTCRCK